MGLHPLDSQAIGIAVTGMVIVFAALLLVSLFIASLPRVLAWVNTVFPEPAGHHHRAPSPRPAAPAASPAAQGDEAAVAAIAYALHHDRGDSS